MEVQGRMGSRLRGNDAEDGFPPMDGDAVFLPAAPPSRQLKADDARITVCGLMSSSREYTCDCLVASHLHV